MSKRPIPNTRKTITVKIAIGTLVAVIAVIANLAQISATFPGLFLWVPPSYRQILTKQEVEESPKNYLEPELITETWVGEHAPYYIGAVDSIDIYEEPDTRSKIVDRLEGIKDKNFICVDASVPSCTTDSSNNTETPKKDFTYDETRFITLSPAIIAARRSLSFDVTDYGSMLYFSRDNYYNSTTSERRTINLKAGDEVEVMRYIAEGAFLLRYKGNVIGASVNISESSQADFGFVKKKIGYEWWIRLISTADRDRPIGWVLVEDSSSETGKLTIKDPYR